MEGVQLFRTPHDPAPNEAEVAAFFSQLDPEGRRFMPLQPAEVLESSFMTWARAGGGELLGLAGCVHRRRLAFLYIATAERARGRGVGRELLEQVLNYGSSRGASIYLSVHAENEPALRLYRKEGFHTIVREPGRYWMMRPSTPLGVILCYLLRAARPLLSLVATARTELRGT